MLADKPFFLVLEEDGTAVDTEEYFQALADDTLFMVLQKGQKWRPPSKQVRSHLLGETIGSLGGVAEECQPHDCLDAGH